jgi:hypothetical protein
VPTLLSPNVLPDFAHHDGDEVLRCPGAKWHHAPAVLVVYGEEWASPYQVGISPASVYHILTNSLGKRKVCAKWIPHVLNDNQRAMRLLLATTNLQHWRNEGSAFLDRILTVDESWISQIRPRPPHC